LTSSGQLKRKSFSEMKTAAVMQPYVFPYLGYFQLIAASDVFIFYDDVNFIKQGWINRNRILVQGKETMITFPCKKISSFSKINEVELLANDKPFRKILKSIEQSYSKSSQFQQVYPVIEEIFNHRGNTIADFAMSSITTIARFLGMNQKFLVSSRDFSSYEHFDRADRLIAMCQSLDCNRYINSIGGQDLYDRSYFKQSGIELQFLKPELKPYFQLNRSDFAPGMSIIDVLMNCSVKEVNKMLGGYELE